MGRTKLTTKSAPRYFVVKGFNYGELDERVEAGQPLPPSIPAPVIEDLLEDSAIVAMTEDAAEPLPEPITEVEQWPSSAE